MEGILFYLLKVCLASSVMVATYLIFFRKENLLLFNRFYLISAALVPWIFPLVTITYTRQLETLPDNGMAMIPAMADIFEADFTPMVGSINLFILSTFIIYASGVLFFFVKLMMSFFKINMILKKCSTELVFNETVYFTEENLIPFSYLNKTVISLDHKTHPHLDLIIRHEKIHVSQWHTIDILLSEVFKLLQWFSPFAWILGNVVKTNLEYIADAGVTEKDCNIENYQYTLINMIHGSISMQLVNSFGQNQIKKRIIMMKKNFQRKRVNSKCLLVLPVMTFLLFSLCNKEISYDPRINPVITGVVTNSITDEPYSGVTVAIKGTCTGVTTNVDGAYRIALTKPSDTLQFGLNTFVLPGGRNTINVALSPGVAAQQNQTPRTLIPEGYRQYVDGKRIEGTITDAEYSPQDFACIEMIKVKTAIRNDGSMQEGNFWFGLFYTRNRADGTVSDAGSLPLQSENYPSDPGGLSDTIVIRGIDKGPDIPCYIVDGDRIEDDGEVIKIHPEAIAAVRSYKGDQAYNITATDEAWQQGVVIIETKKDK